ncbi:MAG: phage tail protein [Candidatus Methylumidiphilus sp.]
MPAINSDYPIPSYNYRVSIFDGSDSPTISFSEVTGLSREYNTATYRHGLSFAVGYMIIPLEIKPIQISLKRGLISSTEHIKYLAEWFESMEGWKRLSIIQTRDINIALCDANGDTVITWKVIGAIPVKLVGPDFVASSQDVAIERMDIIAKDLKVDFN